MQSQQGLAWVADHESSALKRLNNEATLQQALFLETPGNGVSVASITSKIGSIPACSSWAEPTEAHLNAPLTRGSAHGWLQQGWTGSN